MMNNILQPYLFKFVVVYLDDILIYSESFEDHVIHLEKVFQSLRKYNLMINHEKCYYGFEELCYLGHIIGKGLLQPDNTNLNKIKIAPVPNDLKTLRAFLGLTFTELYFYDYCSKSK